MKKVIFIVHEEFTGRHKPEEVFAAVFLSNTAALTEQAEPSIIEYTD